MVASTEIVRSCSHCGCPIPKGKNYLTKKFCRRACYNASKPYTPEQRASAFWAKVDKTAGADACWPWVGAITTHGYGCVQTGNGRVLGSHKIAYVLSNGPVPDGQQVCHICDNRLCCNPKHFFLGTKLDNARDAVAKDRHARGERNSHAKLTEDQVQEIRALRGSVTQRELAARYGVDQSTIGSLMTGRSWKHLSD